MRQLKSHVLYHLSLICILALGFVSFVTLNYDRDKQIAVLILTFAIYSAWGIIHHYINHDLVLKIVVEYILIGVLGLSIVMFILRGGIGI